MAAPAQSLDINTLHNVHVAYLINSHWTECQTKDFSLEYFQGCYVVILVMGNYLLMIKDLMETAMVKIPRWVKEYVLRVNTDKTQLV